MTSETTEPSKEKPLSCKLLITGQQEQKTTGDFCQLCTTWTLSPSAGGRGHLGESARQSPPLAAGAFEGLFAPPTVGSIYRTLKRRR